MQMTLRQFWRITDADAVLEPNVLAMLEASLEAIMAVLEVMYGSVLLLVVTSPMAHS